MTDLQMIIQKLASFCAYQDRCKKEILEKLATYQLSESQTEIIMTFLENEKFLNEARFAASFVRGKFRHNQWGKIKIRYELQHKNIANELITQAFAEISEEEYQEMITDLMLKKWQTLKKFPLIQKKQKVYQYMISKGFETDKIMREIEALSASSEVSKNNFEDV